jgi:hypothetical protein
MKTINTILNFPKAAQHFPRVVQHFGNVPLNLRNVSLNFQYSTVNASKNRQKAGSFRNFKSFISSNYYLNLY